MRKKIKVFILMCIVAGIVVVSQLTGEELLKRLKDREGVQTAGKTVEPVIMIDSGHGGADPGKIGINDALEKDINLQIAQKIQDLLEEKNIKVMMTRESEEGLGESRAEDLKARVELINRTKPLLTVSIHQNSYPDEKVHGAQVFYYTHSKEGEKAAKTIQENLREMDPENHRQVKANDTYYMLKKTEAPVVIVECGFLSNPREAHQLCNEEYQRKMAEAIVKGILAYTD